MSLADIAQCEHVFGHGCRAYGQAQLAQRVGRVKINLIPYNFTDLGFQRSIHERTAIFKELLEGNGLTVTVRKTMGDDIAAACGQLITIKKT